MFSEVCIDVILLYMCGIDTVRFGKELGAIRWTHYWKLSAHMPEPKSPSHFLGSLCKPTVILGLVLKADKPCVGL